MKRTIPLSLKLGLAFAVATLLSIGLNYYLTSRAISDQFYEYGRETREIVGSQLAIDLGNRYIENGGWRGIDIFRPVYITINQQVYIGSIQTIGGRFAISKEDGNILVTTESNDLIGTPIADLNLDVIIPITAENEEGDEIQVGALGLIPVTMDREVEFLESIATSTLLGGGIGIVLALTLSVLLILQILSPLRKLAQATEQVASGELPKPIQLRSHDELGQLGHSFDQMVESLRRSEHLRQMMTADIAHELRTPVTIIQGTLEALLDGVYEPSAETIAPIYEETLHLGRLIDDLRDLVLAEAGELRLDLQPTDLGELARHVVEAAMVPKEGDLTIDVDVLPGVPSVLVDPKRMRQVIANLLSNALRHTPADGSIEIMIRSARESVVLVVTDSGTGIPEDDLPHLFERFYRGDRARRRGGGTGLGLAIVKQWIEAHGGTIEAGNASDGGARFTIRLPLS